MTIKHNHIISYSVVYDYSDIFYGQFNVGNGAPYSDVKVNCFAAESFMSCQFSAWFVQKVENFFDARPKEKHYRKINL